MRTNYARGSKSRVSLYDVAFDAIRAIPSLPEDSKDSEIEAAINKITEEVVEQIKANLESAIERLAEEVIS